MTDAESGGVTHLYPSLMTDDLARSGITPADIRARPLEPSQKSVTGTPQGLDGYVIPYFDIRGRTLPHYRVRLYEPAGLISSGGQASSDWVKYRQPKDSQNHVYFPPRLQDLLPTARYLILTEGEKKAAAAVSRGIPCSALGGVDSWRSRTLGLPKDTNFAKKADGNFVAKLPEGGGANELDGPVAVGFGDMVSWAVEKDVPIVICYDTDTPHGVSFNVQRAAAVLGFELRFRGVPLRNVRQLVLPHLGAMGKGPGEASQQGSHQGSPVRSKTGLDDFLAERGPEAFELLVSDLLAKRTAFPLHPNIRDYVNKQLARYNLPRQGKVSLSLAILADLDEKGQRLRSSESGQLYYFDRKSKALTPVEFTGKPDFAESPFGRFLYGRYGVGINDQAALGWLSSSYSGEPPIDTVSPERVLAWRGDILYYQIDSGHIARVDPTKETISIVDNGTDNVLFEANQTEGLTAQDFSEAYESIRGRRLENWWYVCLREARIQSTPEDRHRYLLSFLYYISPFFFRWRGTQLPVEITTGEAGSGKSTLFELRLDILTGIPHLRNTPKDLKDWDSSLANSGGIHVTDNMQFTDNSLRQSLSDEVARITTEPRPTIEQRKLYTNTGIVRIPIRCTFGFTGIRQPFTNIDIIQRSIITELDKGTDENLTYDASWGKRQLFSRGGRAGWLAHHLHVVHQLLKLVNEEWNYDFRARYRLINVEQLLKFTAQLFGSPTKGDWIPDFLEQSRDKRASDNDWALEGLVAFIEAMKVFYPTEWSSRRYAASDISAWAQGEEDFNQCNMLINSRQLGRYIKQHQHTVSITTGLIGQDMGNRIMYRVRGG